MGLKTTIEALGLAEETAEGRRDALMSLALQVAKEMSDDQDTQTACVAVLADGTVLAEANRMPDGVLHLPERLVRPEKYDWIEHAERNVVFEAAAEGYSLKGAELYLPWFPCPECARALAGARVSCLHAVEPDLNLPRWGATFPKAMNILKENGVRVILGPDPAPAFAAKASAA